MGNTVADELGNELSDKEAAAKAKQKVRERILALARKYEIDVKLPKKGPFGFGAVAKVGAVCCDCEGEESAAFCRDVLGREHGDVPLPSLTWVEGGSLQLLKKAISVPGAIEYAFDMMGYLPP